MKLVFVLGLMSSFLMAQEAYETPSGHMNWDDSFVEVKRAPELIRPRGLEVTAVSPKLEKKVIKSINGGFNPDKLRVAFVENGYIAIQELDSEGKRVSKMYSKVQDGVDKEELKKNLNDIIMSASLERKGIDLAVEDITSLQEALKNKDESALEELKSQKKFRQSRIDMSELDLVQKIQEEMPENPYVQTMASVSQKLLKASHDKQKQYDELVKEHKEEVAALDKEKKKWKSWYYKLDDYSKRLKKRMEVVLNETIPNLNNTIKECSLEKAEKANTINEQKSTIADLESQIHIYQTQWVDPATFNNRKQRAIKRWVEKRDIATSEK